MEKKEIRAGILRESMFSLTGFISKFFTGEAKFINKNLSLKTVRKIEDGIPNCLPYYDFVFLGDDLPVVPYGCWPLFIKEEPVEGEKGSFRLVADTRANKNK